MALQLGDTRKAFKAANVPDDLAEKAAEELAAYERHFADLRADISDVRGSIRVLQWGQGVTFAMTLAILLKLFVH